MIHAEPKKYMGVGQVTLAQIAEWKQIDSQDMFGAIQTMPMQLQQGYELALGARQEIAELLGGSLPRAVVVCGMGGSGVAGDLVSAMLDLEIPVIPVKGYELPAWVNREDVVVCVSYSGNTSETIACFTEASDRSRVVAVISTGGKLSELAAAASVPTVQIPSGYQPRAACGILTGALCGVLESAEVVSSAADAIRGAVNGAARSVNDVIEVDDVSTCHAFELAKGLQGRCSLVYGTGITAPVAARWKAQLNENAKVPAFANEYPELNHNELVGWELAGTVGGPWGLIELLPSDCREGIERRVEVTGSLIENSVDWHRGVRAFNPSGGEPVASDYSRAHQVFELLVLGDYVSVLLAYLNQVDPTPVERIHLLKDKLGAL